MLEANYTQSSRKWTKESIIATIQANTVDGYCKSTDVGMSLTTMSRRLFGSFEAAIAASGVKMWSSKPKLDCCSIDGCDREVRSPRSDYCETHYYRIRRTGNAGAGEIVQFDLCHYCGAKCGKKYCNGTCRARSERGTPLLSPCKICGTGFKSVNKNVCCSAACLAELMRVNARNWYAKACLRPEHVKKVRDNEYKRKARKVNAFVEEVDLQVIYKRDKGICWLCEKPVDITLKWPDLGFSTLDHVVPLAKGGLHCYGNIKLAHLSCNCKKGDKTVVEASSGGMPLPERGQVPLF